MPPRRKSKAKLAPKKQAENAPVDASLDPKQVSEVLEHDNLPLNDNKTSERRASVLFRASDDIVRDNADKKSAPSSQRRQSIDNAISSLARLSAVHTDGSILRKDSVSGVGEMQAAARQANKELQDNKNGTTEDEVDLDRNQTNPGTGSGLYASASALEAPVSVSNGPEGQDFALESVSKAPEEKQFTPEIRETAPEHADISNPASECSDPFESAIKQNKLEFDDDPSPEVPQGQKLVPEVSPMTVPNDIPAQKQERKQADSAISELEIEGAQQKADETLSEQKTLEQNFSEQIEDPHQSANQDLQGRNEHDHVYYRENREQEDHRNVASAHQSDTSIVGDTAPSQHIQSEEADPPTLINDQRLSEVQEYIPGVKEEETEDFQPDLQAEAQEENSKAGHEHGESELAEVPDLVERSIEDDSLSEPLQSHYSANVPVEVHQHLQQQSEPLLETPQKVESESHSGKLPWEKDEHVRSTENTESNNQLPWGTEAPHLANLPWEVESAAESQTEVNQQQFPWEKEEQTEQKSLPWEQEQVHLSEEVLPWEKELKDDNLKAEQLPWATDKTTLLSGEIPSFSGEPDQSHQKHVPLEPEDAVSGAHDSVPGSQSIPSKEQVKQSSDFLDDDDFLDDPPLSAGANSTDANNGDDPHLEEGGYPNTYQNHVGEARYNSGNHNWDEPTKAAPQPALKDKSLDFLDLDDDLLDDDFLPEEPKAAVSPIIEKKPRQTYVPTSAVAPPHYAAPATVQKSQEFSKSLEAAKKKNDAYDFPASLISQKVKPAARNTKYAPAPLSMAPPANSSGSVGPQQAQGSFAPPPAASSTPLSGNAPPVPPKTIQKQKSFFEELPISMPQKAPRPARAAASVSTTLLPGSNQFQLPSLPPALPAKSPVNPYAQMGPKPGQQGPNQNLPPAPHGILPPLGGIQPTTGSLQQNNVPPVPPQQGRNQYAPTQQGTGFNGPNQFGPPPAQNQYTPVPPAQSQYAPHPGPNQFGPPPGQNQYAPAPPGQNMPPSSFPNHPLPAQQLHPTQFPPSQQQRRSSINSPSNIAANLVKDSKGQLTSPYIPNAGPYAPSSRQKTHSRANSLVGAKNKEVNPYAPALPPVTSEPQPVRGVVPPPNTAPVAQPFANPGPGTAVAGYASRDPYSRDSLLRDPPHRAGVYARPLPPVAKVQDPNALLQRQFPIFQWSESLLVVSLVPNAVHNAYDHNVGSIKVRPAGEVLRNKDFFQTFPGPLGKSKSSKKELEKWLDTNTGVLRANGSNPDELLLAEVLHCLVKHDGDVKAPEFPKAVCSVINPTVDYAAEVSFPAGAALNTSANAYKLDTAGINTVWGLVQAGRADAAVEYALSKSDWAIALIISASLGPERFAKIASDYARTTFPSQTSQTKVQHLMPVLLKVFAGQTKGVVDDFIAIPSEGEWACLHYREIVAAVFSNGSSRTNEFLVEFGHFLSTSGHTTAAEVCYMLAGVPLGVPFPNGRLFSTVGSETFSAVYTEVYEYALQMPSSPTPGPAMPHMLILKLQHAQVLADYGLFVEAQKYCDYIGTSLKSVGKLPVFGPAAFHEFQKLLERLSGASSNDNSWFSTRISKVNLDKMWGHLDKFIGGEDTKPASSENGVFSKFSPSVSRNASTVDFSALPQTLPQVRNEYSRDTQATLAPVSAPTTASEGSILGFSRPPLAQTNSSSAVQKYLPGFSQSSGPATQRPEPHQSNPLTGNLSYQVSPGTHMGHQMSPGGPSLTNGVQSYPPPQQSPGSPSNLNSQLRQGLAVSDLLPPKRLHSKYLPGQKGMAPPRTYPYGNRSAQASTLSLGSHLSINPPHVWGGPQQASGTQYQRQHSVTSINSVENDIQTQPISQGTHQRTSSVQSDVSIDFPQDFKPAPRRQEPNEDEDRANELFRESIRAPIRESPELDTQASIAGPPKPVSGPANPASAVPQPISRIAQNIPLPPLTGSVLSPPVSQGQQGIVPETTNLPKETSNIPKVAPLPQEPISRSEESGYVPKEDASQSENVTTEPKSAITESENTIAQSPSETPPSTSSLPPPKAAARPRANPYAPGGVTKPASRAGKYGPSLSTSKYSVPGDSTKTGSGIMTGVSSDISYGDTFNYSSATPESAAQTHQKEPSKTVSDGIRQETPKFEPHALQPPQRPQNVNVDVSFDSDRAEDDFTQSPPPTGSLLLNTETSPGQLPKDSLFNPYQSDRRRPAGFGGINSEFGDFPIPGSPELTTRANSVIGGPGLFSLRLSQSHQLALYQQYDVQDDTVRDYVLFPEEDEEDESIKEADKKKEEQERKARIVADKAKQKADAAAAKRQASAESSGWLNWLGGNKNDGKPKPVRVHLGEANKLVYNEEHKRWINPAIPLEEQLAANKAPPPPKKKVVDAPKPPGGAVPRPSGGAPPGKTPENAPAAAPPAPGGPPPPSLASAGLEDLISLGSAAGSVAGSTGAGRKGRKARGRGYVNVLEQK